MEKLLYIIIALNLLLLVLVVILLLKKPHERAEVGGKTAQAISDLSARQKYATEATLSAVDRISAMQKEKLGDIERRVADASQATEYRLDAMRKGLDDRLRHLSDTNERQLAEMRGVVDEKLSKTLETRLAKSFELVSSRLEAVYKGIGEVNSLAEGVSDIKRIFTNVKLRGTWGETQLDALLSQMLSPAQFGRQVQVNPLSGERVDFAVYIPGKDDGVIYMPIDSKFPVEEYNRMLSLEEEGKAARAAAERGLASRIKKEAEEIAQKYILPPRTTDFALMYLPSEGLYAEVVKNDALMEHLHRIRVMVAGPGTLGAMLMSLQTGFKSIAIEKRSAELWQLLAAFRAEFSRFAELLNKTQKKLAEAQDTIDSAAKRTRQIEKKLSSVDGLEGEQQLLFPEEE